MIRWLARILASGRGRRALQAFAHPHAMLSYAQSGEDLILLFLFEMLGTARPTYLDLGAHDPVWLNNTFLFYQRGARGVCVDANPEMVARLRRRRPGDVCVHAAVVAQPCPSVRLYVTDNSAMSSTIDPAAYATVQPGMAVSQVLEVPAMTLGKIIDRHCPRPPDLLSIDLEGCDLEVLRSIDLERWRPRAICAETLFVGEPAKSHALIEHLAERGYHHYANTFINDIFIDYELWRRCFPLWSAAAPVGGAARELAAALSLLARKEGHHHEAATYAHSLERELDRQRAEYAKLAAAFEQHQTEALRYVESLRAELDRREGAAGRGPRV